MARSTRATVELEDGVKFEGHLRGGERSGWGKLTFPEGSALVGTFRDGALNGFGYYTNEDGERLQGQWSDGELNGEVKRYSPILSFTLLFSHTLDLETHNSPDPSIHSNISVCPSLRTSLIEEGFRARLQKGE
eukprot:4315116-Pyramimonas_sp.AAC.1